MFTNDRFSDGLLRGLNLGCGVRWLNRAIIGLVQRDYPDGSRGDDVTKPLFGDAQTSGCVKSRGRWGQLSEPAWVLRRSG